MKLWKVQYEERRHRAVTVVAPSAEAARKAVKNRKGDYDCGIRILGATESMLSPAVPDGMGALLHILSSKYLPLDREETNLLDWIGCSRAAQLHAHETDPKFIAHLERGLALAGIRVRASDAAQHLYIAGSEAVPFLPMIFEGTPWQDCGWRKALRTLPGAIATQNTFAGTRSRSIRLPLNEAIKAVSNEGRSPGENLH